MHTINPHLKLLNLLQERSKENPISRSELAIHMGLHERLCRELIADLQSQGHPIVALKKGYWFGTPEELMAYKNREYKRVKTLLKKLTCLVPEYARPKVQECFDFFNTNFDSIK